MKQRLKRISFILAAVLALSLITGCGSNQSGEEENPLSRCVVARRAQNSNKNYKEKQKAEVESSMPDLHSFTAETLDGGTLTEEDFASRDLTVINIWSTTCPPCIDEMPELAALARSLPENISLITWCLDGADVPEEAGEIVRAAGFENATLISGDGDLINLYKELMYTPTTVAVDSSGNMVGEPMIGSPEDVETAYKEYINQALAALGKDQI